MEAGRGSWGIGLAVRGEERGVVSVLAREEVASVGSAGRPSVSRVILDLVRVILR